VSLSPAITEALATLGALDRVVGRSDWCSTPAEVTRLPAVGSSLTPALERIAGLRPTHVLADASAGTQAEALGRLGQLETLPWLTVDDVIASTRRLGALTQREAEATTLAERLAALQAPPPASAPRVLLALDDVGGRPSEVWYVRADSLHGAALSAAGAQNVLEAPPSGQPALSIEALLRLDPPNVIVLAASNDPEAARARALETWSTLGPLAAVRAGRVEVVATPTALSTGPSILGTVEALRAALTRLATRP
jgi:iron complex transport system substrate-binding protein